MRHLDLFSGIGSWALAARHVWGDEYECVGFCEIDYFCRQVLTKHFLGVPIYGAINKFADDLEAGIIRLNLCKDHAHIANRNLEPATQTGEKDAWPKQPEKDSTEAPRDTKHTSAELGNTPLSYAKSSSKHTEENALVVARQSRRFLQSTTLMEKAQESEKQLWDFNSIGISGIKVFPKNSNSFATTAITESIGLENARITTTDLFTGGSHVNPSWP